MSRGTRRRLTPLWWSLIAAAILAGLAIASASYSTAAACIDTVAPTPDSGCRPAGGGFAMTSAGWTGLAACAVVLLVSATALASAALRRRAAR